MIGVQWTVKKMSICPICKWAELAGWNKQINQIRFVVDNGNQINILITEFTTSVIELPNPPISVTNEIQMNMSNYQTYKWVELLQYNFGIYRVW